jgi:hypothetical protein
MPVQYYLPRNILTYQFRYTDNGVSFRHYIINAPSFIVCAIALLCDIQPCKTSVVPNLLSLMDILIDGVTKEGLALFAFFKHVPVTPILDAIHYASMMLKPTKHTLVLFKTHVMLYKHCDFVNYTLFLFSKFSKEDIVLLQKLCVVRQLFNIQN